MVSKQKRCGIYVRVSTDKQTTENQRLELERLAQQRNWIVAEVFEDSGVSGAKASRPAFDRMRKDAARGKLDVILVWAIDRLGRSLAAVATCLDELQQQGVAVVILQQNVDGTTSSGRAMLGMCAVFAQFERDMLRDRIYAGLDRARAQGKRLGRPTTLTPGIERQIRAKLAKGVGMLRIGRELGVGTSTVQRIAGASKAA